MLGRDSCYSRHDSPPSLTIDLLNQFRGDQVSNLDVYHQKSDFDSDLYGHELDSLLMDDFNDDDDLAVDSWKENDLVFRTRHQHYDIDPNYQQQLLQHSQNNNQIEKQTNRIENDKEFAKVQGQKSGPGLTHVSAIGRTDFQQIFGFQYFNKMQSDSFTDAFKSDRNIVLSAPTGAGKTGVMELAILRLLHIHGQANTKVIYISPTKALCDERQRDWAARFKSLHLTCNSLTGDTQFSEIKVAQESNIIVTTPEKWDSITRQFNDTHRLVNLVGLLLIDELHTIKDGVRGACLEAVITRMKSLQKTIRILAVSATVPNVKDFADWLVNADTGKSALVKQFGQEFRPVPLQTIVVGYPVNGNHFTFDDSLKYRLLECLKSYSKSKPSLIFCTTRKSAINTADYLSREINSTEPFVTLKTKNLLLQASKKIRDKKLAQLVATGIAFHHGGLDYYDRREIESLFSQSILLVILSTSTLAVGVNLPAHLVIIKGTQYYDYTSDKKTSDYSDLDVMQMIGRAGRPQFDSSATAVIFTTTDKKSHYENMGKQVIESSLHESLMEHLNTEISLKSIQNEEQATTWLHSTFLYVRIQKNPSYYRLKNCGSQEAGLSGEKRLEAIFLKDLSELEKGQLVIRSKPDLSCKDFSVGSSISATEYGSITTRNYLRFPTVQIFIRLKAHASERDLLEAMSKSDEFGDVRFHSDKKLLNDINKDPGIKYPVVGRVTEIHQKVFLIIQSSIGGVSLEHADQQKATKTHSLSFDAKLIMRNATRILKGMVAILIAKEEYRSILSALKLTQAIKVQLWSNSSLKTRQIEGVGNAIAKAFSKAGIDSFSKLLLYDASRINMIAGRNPPFGAKVLEAASRFPQLSMSLLHVQPISLGLRKNLNVEVTVTVGLLNPNSAMTNIKSTQIVYYFVAGTSLGNFIETRRFPISKLVHNQVFTLKTRMKNEREAIVCSMISCEIVGTDIEQSVLPFAEQPKICRSLTNNDSDSFMDDDDSFWNAAALIDTTSSTLNTLTQVGNSSVLDTVVLDNGYVPCKHTCSNKKSCRHLCCREGVPVSGRKRKNNNTSESANSRLQSESFHTAPPATTSKTLKNIRKKMVILDDADICRGRSSPPIGSDGVMDSPTYKQVAAPPLVKRLPAVKQRSDLLSSFPGDRLSIQGSLGSADKEIWRKEDDFAEVLGDDDYDFKTSLPSMCVKIPDVESHAYSFLEEESEIPTTSRVSPLLSDGREKDFDLTANDQVPASNESPCTPSILPAASENVVPSQGIDREVDEPIDIENTMAENDECCLMFFEMFQ